MEYFNKNKQVVGVPLGNFLKAILSFGMWMMSVPLDEPHWGQRGLDAVLFPHCPSTQAFKSSFLRSLGASFRYFYTAAINQLTEIASWWEGLFWLQFQSIMGLGQARQCKHMSQYHFRPGSKEVLNPGLSPSKACP